jgi:hypothetical protein
LEEDFQLPADLEGWAKVRHRAAINGTGFLFKGRRHRYEKRIKMKSTGNVLVGRRCTSVLIAMTSLFDTQATFRRRFATAVNTSNGAL